MELKSGHFNIFPILEFVAQNPEMPSPKSKCQKLYKCEINKLIEGVPSDKPGWYLWGRFNDNQLTRLIIDYLSSLRGFLFTESCEGGTMVEKRIKFSLSGFLC